jgi:hypothetical protein
MHTWFGSFLQTPWPYTGAACVLGACASLVGGIVARARRTGMSPATQRWAWSGLLVAAFLVYVGLNALSAVLGTP